MQVPLASSFVHKSHPGIDLLDHDGLFNQPSALDAASRIPISLIIGTELPPSKLIRDNSLIVSYSDSVSQPGFRGTLGFLESSSRASRLFFLFCFKFHEFYNLNSYNNIPIPKAYKWIAEWGWGSLVVNKLVRISWLVICVSLKNYGKNIIRRKTFLKYI